MKNCFNHSGNIDLRKQGKPEKRKNWGTSGGTNDELFTYDIVSSPGFSSAGNVENHFICNEEIYLAYEHKDLYTKVIDHYKFYNLYYNNNKYEIEKIYDPVMCRYKYIAREK